VRHVVIAETGAAAGLGQIDVDISEAGEGWGEEDIIIDEGLMEPFFYANIVIASVKEQCSVTGY